MVRELVHPFAKYLRAEMMPHIWCAGCGNGIVLNCFVHALDELKTDLNKLVIVSGIGCIGRVAGYTYADSFHTTHGRALAFATGVKLANPELEVVVISGDGDLFAIGGNHFIHAARRNIGVKVICVNNFNYGMTGGQQGPTTPLDSITATSPYGNVEHPFNLVHLAAASGSTYVARWTTLHVRRLTQSLKKLLQKEGFCFVEVLSPCPEIFGRVLVGIKNSKTIISERVSADAGIRRRIEGDATRAACCKVVSADAVIIGRRTQLNAKTVVCYAISTDAVILRRSILIIRIEVDANTIVCYAVSTDALIERRIEPDANTVVCYVVSTDAVIIRRMEPDTILVVCCNVVSTDAVIRRMEPDEDAEIKAFDVCVFDCDVTYSRPVESVSAP